MPTHDPHARERASMSRMFFALWPEPGVRELARTYIPTHGRCVAPEDLHVTLVFLGNVTEDAQTVLERAAASVTAEAFTLVLDQHGGWRRSGIAWLGASRVPEPLSRLQRLLAEAAADIGVPPEARDYVPHLTLARQARTVRTREIAPIEWPVGGFCLVRSRLQETPKYQVVNEFLLTPARE